MNYNLLVVISIVICAIISYVLSYYVTLLILDENSGFFKIVQLFIAVVSLSSFYAPIKFMLMKFMNFKEEESDKDK